MLCDDINYFERAEFVTTNFKNVLCSKMYQLASITPQCTLVSVPVSSKTGHLLPGYTQGICLEVCFVHWGILPAMRPAQFGIRLSCENTGQRQKWYQSNYLICTFSVCNVLTGHCSYPDSFLEDLRPLKLKTTNIPWTLTTMCSKSEMPGGLTEGGARAVWNWLVHLAEKIVHLPESVLIIFLYYLLSDSNNYCLTML